MAKSIKQIFAADKTERRRVADLKPYKRNPKTHPPEQITALVAMIKEFGFTEPLIIDEEDTILAGHGRTMAAQELGFAELPVVVMRGLTESQKRALVIADNKSNEMGGWNQDLLIAELNELKLSDYPIELTGFSSTDLVSFVAEAGAAENDRAQNVGSLAAEFGIPPFSILNAREGWWQDRKRGWLALGIQSELGRGENLIGRSIFDRCAVLLGLHYDEVRKFVEARRAEGLDDVAIEAAAIESSSSKRRKKGKGISGSQRLAPGGNLAGRMAGGDGTKRKKADAIPGGAGKNSVYRNRNNLGVANG